MSKKIFAFFVLLLFLYVTSPLLVAVSMGAVLSVLLIPLLERLEKRKIPTLVGASLLTLFSTLLFILPASMLLFFMVKTGVQQFQIWKASAQIGGANLLSNFLDMRVLDRLVNWVSYVYPVQKPQLLEAIQEIVMSVGLKIADALGQMMTRLPGMTMSLVIMILCVFFFLMDGRKIVLFVRKNSFFTPSQTEQFISAMGGISRSVVLASVVSGAAQACLEFIAVLIIGIPNPLLIGGLVFLASFIPLVGAAPVTFGLAAYQLLIGSPKTALVLLIVAVVVSIIDNFIRPLFLKGTSDLHPLLAFIAALGGLQTIGVLGIFLGPVIAAMFIATIQLITLTDPASLLDSSKM